VALLPPLFEGLFGGLLTLEARLVGALDLPIGASVFAVARKPGA
jgi:hypothetical protein